MVQNAKEITPELEHLLGNFFDYPTSQKPSNIKYWLVGLKEVYQRLYPYLIQSINQEEPILFSLYPQYPSNVIPKWLEEGFFSLAQVYDIKVIRVRFLEDSYVEPIYSFNLIGTPTNIALFNIIWVGLLNLYKVRINLLKKDVQLYNQKIRFHKRKSPWLVKHKSLSKVKIKRKFETKLRLRIILRLHELMILRYEQDAHFIKSNNYLAFRKKVNKIIKEYLGPRWEDKIKETKTVKYYFGLKPFKVQNRWMNTKKLPGFLNRIKELKSAIKSCPLIPIPKNLPPMPRHSRKVKGALERWKPKSYR